MGARSPLVLAKLGFDLRAYYDDLLNTPPPEHLRALVERLPKHPAFHVVQPAAGPALILASDDPSLA